MDHRDPRANRTVLILATVLFLWFLWGHDLWAPDEPTYGEVAREMVVDGQWIVPHVIGAVYNHKPPFFFWLIALLSLPFGQVTEFTARLPSVLAAIGAIALTMRLGVRWYGPRTAAMAGVILASSFMFWEKARSCQPDMLLCLLIWLALTAFIDFRSENANGRLAGAVFWTATALGVLTKWLVGIVIPLGIAVLTLAIDRQPSRAKNFAPLLGPFLFAAITGAWVAAASLWGPEGYSVWGSLWEHFFQRGLHGMHHVAPPWFYLTSLPVSALPWAGLLPGALLLAWRRRKDPNDRFLLITTLFIVGVFSISAEKRDLYILPALPAIALMMANLAGTVAGWSQDAPQKQISIHRRWVTAGHSVVGGLVLLIGLALPVAGLRIHEVPYWTIVATAVMALALGGSALWLGLHGRALRSVIATAAGTALIYLFVTAVVFPALNPTKSDRLIAERAAAASAESRAAGHEVAAFRTRNLPKALAFYGDGLYTWETWDLGELQRHLSQKETVFAVLYESDLAEIRPRVMKRVEIVDRAPHSRREVLLISNSRKPDRRNATK